MKRFDNMTVLITGGTGGIGLATVKEFLNEGAFVYFTDMDEKRGLKLEGELGKHAKFIKHDVTSEKDWEHVVSTIKNKHQTIDVLANVAGVANMAFIKDIPLDLFTKVLAVNQAGVFLGQKYALDLLKRKSKSSIINIASVAGLKGTQTGAAYNSSKAGVISLTQTGALEFGKYGIRVNSISPGVVKTNMTAAPDLKDLIAQMVEKTPIARGADPKEIARALLFLASDDASFMTGSNLVVDGGANII